MLRCVATTSGVVDGVVVKVVVVVCGGGGVGSCSGDGEWHAAFCRLVMLSW